MPLRRSAHNIIQDAQPSNRDTVTSRLKRGLHGFYKLKNGLLKVTPIGDEEKSLCNANAQDSDLLRLPPEIRMMIWNFALSGQTIKLADRAKPALVTDRFVLLRTCRQIYAEAATVPYATNTFCLANAERYANYVKAGRLNLIQHIKVLDTAACYSKTSLLAGRESALRNIDVTIWRPRWHILSPTPFVAINTEAITKKFRGQKLTITFVDNARQWFKFWKTERIWGRRREQGFL